MAEVGKKQKVEVSQPELQKCNICHKLSATEGDDLALFGDWMETKKLRIHYFCLLLSTHLAQTGKDDRGLLGFLIRDIRNEINQAAKRSCCYCEEKHASIACHNCKEYFHLACGVAEKCLFKFENEFVSYCNKCVPLDEKQKELQEKPPIKSIRCYICKDAMGPYNSVQWIYGPCCGHGYVHRICMLKFALNAGYYLRCLWCRDTKFRDLIRQFGIYIPDRDAIWELKGGNYVDLHRGYRRCDMSKCFCPQGRDYTNKHWNLVNCILCGSFGVHNPICITQNPKKRQPIKGFKCETCLNAEQLMAKENSEKSQLQLNVSQLAAPMASLGVNCNADTESQSVIPTTVTQVAADSLKIQTTASCQSENNRSDDTTHVKVLEFEEKDGVVNCIGTITVCINKNDERFSGKSLEEIVQNRLFTNEDIVSRSSDIGIFRIIDDIIAKYANK